MSDITLCDDPVVTFRVLVVDDDPNVSALVRSCIDRAGGLVVCGTAETAEAAVELTRTASPDIVVLDHRLGGDVTGLDVALELREIVPDSHIVMFSAFLGEDDEFDGVDAVYNKDKLLQLASSLRRLVGLETATRGPAMPCPACDARMPLARADAVGDTRSLTCDRCGSVRRWTVAV